MMEARPALGFGWGEFGAKSPPYYRLSSTYPLSTIDVAHNMPLSNAAELGLVGVAMWVVVMLMGIVAPTLGRAPPAVEPWRLALIAIAIAWFVQANLSPLDYAFDNWMIWLWAGIVVGGRERFASLREPAVATRVPSLSAA
jgi:O-antigen ligase